MPSWARTALFLAGVAAASAALQGIAVAASGDASGNGAAAGLMEPQNAIWFAVAMGLVIFATVTALLHLRERGRWTRRERALAAEIAALHGANDRAEVLLGSDRQVVVAWNGREDPRIEGDPSLAGTGGFRRVLAFGSWLVAADAGALENAVDTLRERGEGFRLTVRTPDRRFVDAEGKAIGGRAMLRLRDITGDRLELLRCLGQLDAVRGELGGMTALLDAIPQPVWRRDPDGALAWANQAYLAAVEARTLAEARERGLDLLDRSARDEAGRRRQAGEPFSARLSVVMAGARRTVEVVERPASGGSAGIAVDVSELEALRAELRRHMDAHVRTLDQLPTAVAIFDARQRLVFHNAGYRHLWALDPAFLDGQPLEGEILDALRAARKLPEQADYRSWKAGVLSAYRAVEPRETWWYLPDRRTLRVVANPNPQGGVTYLFDDVSERFQLESTVNALTRVQRETLDALEEGVALFGTDGRLKLANRAFAQLWTLPAEIIAEEPHVDRIAALWQPLVRKEDAIADIRAVVAGASESRTPLARRLERLDGSVLDCGMQPMPDGASLLTFIDVTASVNVERALTEKNEALERAARLRDDFVHHVSYELRSPLTNIIGFTQLLGDETVGALNPRQREYADHIMRSSGALLAIINDILDLASIDTGSMELELGQVDIRDTIEAAVRGIEDRLAESAVELVVEASPDIGSFVADGKRVRQILFNLLSNAVGFSAPGQTVRVVARRTRQEVIFEVSDQGRGIAPEMRARIFERFETQTRGTRHRGVGLGLSIVRSFVELHGGRLDLTSALDRGTRVTCAFPAGGAPQRLAAE